MPVVHEALECHGGNGYVEDAPIARIFREAPLNGIWEGAGNVVCLDVLRAMRRDPSCVDALFAELEPSSGLDPRLDDATAGLRELFTDVDDDEGRARLLVERMALALQGSLLVRNAPTAVAEAFLAGRLGPDSGYAFGTLPSSVDLDTLIARRRDPRSGSAGDLTGRFRSPTSEHERVHGRAVGRAGSGSAPP